MRGSEASGFRKLAGVIAISGGGGVAGWAAAEGSVSALTIGVVAAIAGLWGAARPILGPVGLMRFGDPAGWAEIRRELERSRRHERPFVLARVEVTVGRGERSRPGDAGAALVATLRSQLRTIDTVWRSDSCVYVLLPETTRDEGRAILARIVELAPGLLPGPPRLVAFPEDAVTGGALLAHLHGLRIDGYAVSPAQVPARAAEAS